eukprot:CAMPEP_0194487092 /NCGR_PEP_ID=MMETSP0253-20130528/7504_1 /TAXON_ID=2966 /ORGANISM="Noctiluca scintillans" /LENGTH=288 /DNA_ID=CAMNT_0039327267 /DNA_START=126 /DNA_END=992 /DNA_ORIENTATION=+
MRPQQTEQMVLTTPLKTRVKRRKTRRTTKTLRPQQAGTMVLDHLHAECCAGREHSSAVHAEQRAASEGQTPSRTPGIVFSSEATSLNRIRDENVQLVVWRREKVPTFVSVLSDASLPASALPSFMGETTPGKVVRTMTKALRSQQGRALSDSHIGELVEDIDKLTGIFANLSGSEKIYVKLETLEDNGCSFWHQDCVPFRLVTTYRGPCTQWVRPEHSKATLRRRKFDSVHAENLLLNDVALFKGRDETEFGESLFDYPGIVHRSPRIEGTGVYRVVLVLDIPASFHQ